MLSYAGASVVAHMFAGLLSHYARDRNKLSSKDAVLGDLGWDLAASAGHSAVGCAVSYTRLMGNWRSGFSGAAVGSRLPSCQHKDRELSLCVGTVGALLLWCSSSMRRSKYWCVGFEDRGVSVTYALGLAPGSSVCK